MTRLGQEKESTPMGWFEKSKKASAEGVTTFNHLIC